MPDQTDLFGYRKVSCLEVQEWGADVVVLGTHGRRGIGRMMLGSDAEQIVRTAAVPVLLIRGADAEVVHEKATFLPLVSNPLALAGL